MITIAIRSIAYLLLGFLLGLGFYDLGREMLPATAQADTFSASLPEPPQPPDTGAVVEWRQLPGQGRTAWILRRAEAAVVLVTDPKDGPRLARCYERISHRWHLVARCSGFVTITPTPTPRVGYSLLVDGHAVASPPRETPLHATREIRWTVDHCRKDGCVRWLYRFPAQAVPRV